MENTVGRLAAPGPRGQALGQLSLHRPDSCRGSKRQQQPETVPPLRTGLLFFAGPCGGSYVNP